MNPPRLRDDDTCPPDLRAEIQREAERSDDDPAWMHAGLERLQGAIAAGATATITPKVSWAFAKLPWIVGAIGAATVVGIIALAAGRDTPQTARAPVDRTSPTMTAAEHPAQVNEVQVASTAP